MPNWYCLNLLCVGFGDTVPDVEPTTEDFAGVNLCNEVMPMPCGEHSGRDWAMANWGTAAGVRDIQVTALPGDGWKFLISGDCAWGPPNEECLRLISAYLRERWSFNYVVAIGIDPSDDSTTILSRDMESVVHRFVCRRVLS